MSVTSFPLFLLALIPSVYVATFVHECGHTVVARWQGFVVTSMGMGIGRPFLVWEWRGTKVYLARTRSAGGMTVSYSPRIYGTAGQWAWLMAGGGLANGVVAGVALLLRALQPAGHDFLLALGVANGLGLVNLAPLTAQFGGFTMLSDGAQILRVLRLGTPSGSGPGLLQRIEALGSLWRAIGDTRGQYMHLLPAAVTWAELGDVDEAQRRCDEALSLPIEDPFLRAYGAALRGIIARYAGDIEASAAALQEAEAGFRALDHLPGQFVVAWARAELLLRQGEAASAAASLEELAAHPVLVRRPALRAALLASQLCARAADGDAAEVGTLLNRYTAHPHRAQGQDLRVFTAVARFHAARDEWADADAAYGRALEALRKLYEALALVKPEWATRFLERRADLLAEIRTCWERLGRSDAAARITARFPPAERLNEQRAQSQQARNRRQHRIGLAISLLNLLLAVGIVVGLALAGPVRAGSPAAIARHPLIVRAAVLFLYAVFALVYSAILGIVSLVRRQPASKGGRFTLFLALLPWVVVVVLSVLDATG